MMTTKRILKRRINNLLKNEFKLDLKSPKGGFLFFEKRFICEKGYRKNRSDKTAIQYFHCGNEEILFGMNPIFPPY